MEKENIFFKQKLNPNITTELDPKEETSYQPIANQNNLQNILNKSNKETKVSLPEDIGNWMIPSNELEIQEEIGRGAFGIVFKGK